MPKIYFQSLKHILEKMINNLKQGESSIVWRHVLGLAGHFIFYLLSAGVNEQSEVTQLSQEQLIN